MRRSAMILFAFPVLSVGFLYALVRLSSETETWGKPPIDVPGVPAKHVVTPRMSEASRVLVSRQAPDFSKKAADGENYALRELIRHGPVLLTWKVLFFEQDCQTGQDCRVRNRFVLRNRSSLPVWLRQSGRAVLLTFIKIGCPCSEAAQP